MKNQGPRGIPLFLHCYFRFFLFTYTFDYFDKQCTDICWAIVAVELATAIRWIKNRGKGIEYSYKELVEFVCPGRGILNEKLHNFCYKLNIMSALEYVIKHGVQEAAWSNVQGFSV